MLQAHLDAMRKEEKIVHQVDAGAMAKEGYGFGPALVELSSLDQITEEKFGPILHVLRYDPDNVAGVGAALHAKGYGLTLGIHSRLESFHKAVQAAVPAGDLADQRQAEAPAAGVLAVALRPVEGLEDPLRLARRRVERIAIDRRVDDLDLRGIVSLLRRLDDLEGLVRLHDRGGGKGEGQAGQLEGITTIHAELH